MQELTHTCSPQFANLIQSHLLYFKLLSCLIYVIYYAGDRCQYTVDKCLSTSCENNATCVLEDRDAVCLCQEGYGGNLKGK